MTNLELDEKDTFKSAKTVLGIVSLVMTIGLIAFACYSYWWNHIGGQPAHVKQVDAWIMSRNKDIEGLKRAMNLYDDVVVRTETQWDGAIGVFGTFESEQQLRNFIEELKKIDPPRKIYLSPWKESTFLNKKVEN